MQLVGSRRLSTELGDLIEAVFLEAGSMHAYLRGTGIEVMANSDNVVRGGLTRKHIDVDELLAVVNFYAAAVSLVEPEQEAPGLLRYPTPAPEFVLWKLDPSDGVVPYSTTLFPATSVHQTIVIVVPVLAASAFTHLFHALSRGGRTP